jgi:hypothetical protein
MREYELEKINGVFPTLATNHSLLRFLQSENLVFPGTDHSNPDTPLFIAYLHARLL